MIRQSPISGRKEKHAHPRHRRYGRRRPRGSFAIDRGRGTSLRPHAKTGFGRLASTGRRSARRSYASGHSGSLFGRHRHRIPGLGCATIRCAIRIAADRETRPAYRIPLGSSQDAAPLFPAAAAQSELSTACPYRGVDRALGPRMDIPSARYLRCECPPLVGAAASGWSPRALAVSCVSCGPDPRARHRGRRCPRLMRRRTCGR